MNNRLKTSLLALGLTAWAFGSAHAAPALRSDVAVTSAIVTVGDMFTDAGINAERALFRAPAPGTAGNVSISAIRLAAKRIGITEFATPETASVRVERAGIRVDQSMLKNLIVKDLTNQGIISGNVIAQMVFEQSLDGIHAAIADEPVRLASLRYIPGSGAFTARFDIAGVRKPLDLRGRLDLMMEVAHLRTPLPAGSILSRSDLEMRPVLLRFAENGGVSALDQLIGKELLRPARDGVMLRVKDVGEPELVERSDMVTLFYRKGPLKLTIKGQALNGASAGETVAVLNLVSKKVVHGTAISHGVVEITNDPLQLADLQN